MGWLALIYQVSVHFSYPLMNACVLMVVDVHVW